MACFKKIFKQYFYLFFGDFMNTLLIKIYHFLFPFLSLTIMYLNCVYVCVFGIALFYESSKCFLYLVHIITLYDYMMFSMVQNPKKCKLDLP